MLHVGFVSELHDSIGTGEGRCLRCGASFYVAAPDGRSADEALSALFDKHLAQKHAEEKKADVSCTFAISD
jgi:hypothetical protein